MSTARALLAAVSLSAVGAAAPLAQTAPTMTVFVTSVGMGNGGNLGGLEGADRHCQMLAAAVGRGQQTWRAYLSTQGPGAVNARTRIARGPWFHNNWRNATGAVVVRNVGELHIEQGRVAGNTQDLDSRLADNKINKETALNEKGEPVRLHDILTGSRPDGTSFPVGTSDKTCSNWTSSSQGAAQVGHHDRTGEGEAGTSWNSAHETAGCSQEQFERTGGGGLFYCFAY